MKNGTRYKPYPSYKDSDVEWLGPLPDDWQIKPLKFAVRMNTEVLDEDTTPTLEFRYADISSITADGRIGETESTTFENAPSRARRRVKEGDTIVSTVRTYLKAIAVVDGDADNLIVSTGFAVLRPLDFEPRFLWRLVQSEPFVQSVVANSEGVGYPAIPPSKLGVLRTWCPPREEQRAIAEFLDREMRKIDELIAKKERLIELLEEKRAALIIRTVTRGLNRNARLRDSGIEWLGQIPEHWGVKRLSLLCAFEQGKAHEPFIDAEGKFICVNSRFVSTEGEIRKYCTENHTPVTKGDILMVMSDLPNGRALAKAYHVRDDAPYAVNQRVCRLSPIAAGSRYLFYQLSRSPGLLRYDDGSNQTHLSNAAFTKFPTATPPLSEQAAIAEHLDRETAKLDRLARKVEAAIENLTEYRSALITSAVTGKIDVQEQAQAVT